MISSSSLFWTLAALLATAASGQETYSEWECRPLTAGACVAPHEVPSACTDVEACCPGSIITDWRTGQLTCKHGGTVTKSSEGTDIDALDLASGAFAAGFPWKATALAVVAAVLGYGQYY